MYAYNILSYVSVNHTFHLHFYCYVYTDLLSFVWWRLQLRSPLLLQQWDTCVDLEVLNVYKGGGYYKVTVICVNIPLNL